MNTQELHYLLALQKVPNVGEITAKKLLKYCKNPEAIFKEKNAALLKIPGIGHQTVTAIKDAKNLKLAERELQYINDNKINYWYYQNEDYPKKLQHCIDSPILLFYKGNISINAPKTISIVGTRKATKYGIACCEKLIETIKVFNPTIVSGFAYGIDITAHKAAFKHNLQTIACLAHGFNQIYPKTHDKYVALTEANGGFITDFWSDDPFDRNNFLKRNRLIAGLSDATIVIESAAKGGSLVTADIANSYNREVFAIPGRITDSQSLGCLNLIKHQMAHLLAQPEDLIYILNWQLENETKSIQKQLFITLSDEENKVYNYLEKHTKIGLDAIALNCDFPIQKTSSLLLQMELKGVVRPLPGKLFEAI